MSTSYRFLKPLDVLFLRGNHLFGAAGQHGAALMPPWPSVAASALRSRMLSDAGVDFEQFKRGVKPAGALGEALGTPADPGRFRLAGLWLARSDNGGAQRFHPAPADVVMLDGKLHRMRPRDLALASSAILPKVPVLHSPKAAKPESGWLLNEAGWQAWLKDEVLDADRHTARTSHLYRMDERLGIALDGRSGTAADSAIYTAQAVAMDREAGFICTVQGVEDALVPASGLIRLGGDGRGAAISRAPSPPTPLPAGEGSLVRNGRFKLILTTPGLFDGGWRLAGLQADNTWHGPDGCTAKLVCAAVPRAETVSGWDLASWQPKAAQRAAPTGSVYWFEDFQGDLAALGKLAENGLWGLPGQNDDAQRKAEGFNNVAVGLWR
jgi:CRISPR-associated protein Cmr3